jgi:hypothetical protein
VPTAFSGSGDVNFYHDGGFVAAEPGVNFIDGTNIILGVVDDPVHQYVDVSVEATCVPTPPSPPVCGVQYDGGSGVFAADSGFTYCGGGATVHATGFFQSVAGFYTPAGIVQLGDAVLTSVGNTFNLNFNDPAATGTKLQLIATGSSAMLNLSSNYPVGNTFYQCQGNPGVTGSDEVGDQFVGGICTYLASPSGTVGMPSWSG